MAQQEIRLERLMEILELNPDILAPMALSRSPEFQHEQLLILKDRVLGQWKVLCRKYHEDPRGLHIIGSQKGERLKVIRNAVDLVMQLRVPDIPGRTRVSFADVSLNGRWRRVRDGQVR